MIGNQRGAPAAYRGYRLQALYTLRRALTPASSDKLVFQPEGHEDLSIWDADDILVEAIQVKSYGNLALSDLSPTKSNSFFHRAVALLKDPNPPSVKLVNIGQIGPEMRQAWQAEEPGRSHVTQKLQDAGFEEADIEAIFTEIELIELDESEEQSIVFSFLQETLTGVDPESAFDLLNFWLYKMAEQRRRVTQADLIERVGNVGRFISERYAHQAEWFTSITPLVDQAIPEDQRTRLREEFYAGVSARYEHILADLDFRRDTKLEEVTKAFGSSRVVIIHAASGQGKTALAYRYLHEAYPANWRFSIELIEDRPHALRIARALAGHANAVQAPMAVYVDVSPRDTEWPELVKRLARLPYLQILVTIREEDFRRANISGAEFAYASVELDFDQAEARRIYERAIGAGQGLEFLNFDEAWARFGGRGPLMEFVYLLTQTTTLLERLQQQINRVRDEVRAGQAHSDELQLLRLVAVASAYEARLHVSRLVDKLSLPEPTRTLELFEREYLMRLSPDRQFVEGLHPIRSRILVNLLTSPDVVSWLAVASECFSLMVEEDLESFILYALVDQPADRPRLLEAIKQIQPTTWAGLAGVLRTLLWLGVYNYIEANLEVIDAAREEFGQGWWFILDLDLANIADKALENWSTLLGNLISSERQAKLEQIRARQTPKEAVLELAENWLAQLGRKPLPPPSPTDWSNAAGLCFWSGHQGVAPGVEKWLSDDDLARAIEELALTTLADVSLGLYACNQERHRAWIQANLPVIQARLAQEYNIVYLEEQGNCLKLHFLPMRLDDDDGEQKKTQKGQASSDPLHAETMERIELMRKLFPHYEAYGSQGHGYRFGSLQSPLDSSTTKEGIPISALPPAWLVQVNSIAHGLGNTRYRPDTWAKYVEQVLEMRQLVVTNLQQLQQGLVKYLQRREAVDLLGKYLDTDIWLQCYVSATRPSMLPKPAVDPWGFAQESSSNFFAHSIQQQLHLPTAIALREYGSYHKAERDYTFHLSNFVQQAQEVMVTNFHVGKLPAHSAQRAKLLELLQQKGIKTDLAHLTTVNLDTARDALSEYQRQFRALFGHRVDDAEKLRELESREADLTSSVWELWYFFSHEPGQGWASPLSQVPARINLKRRQLEKKLQEAVAKVTAPGINIEILSAVKGWNGAPTLWLRLDLEDPMQLYLKFEELVASLREIFGPIDLRGLDYYVIKQNWEYIALVPVVRGQMLSRLAWRLHTCTLLLNRDGIEQHIWSYIPQELPAENWEELGLTLWDLEDLALANQLSAAVATLSLLVAQLSDLANIPKIMDPAEQTFQAYLGVQSSRLSQTLQIVFDVMGALAYRFNDLPEQQQQERASLLEAAAGLIELHKLVRPTEEFDGTQFFTIDMSLQYTQRLEQARPLAEGIRLLWIKDVLDLIPAASIYRDSS